MDIKFWSKFLTRPAILWNVLKYKICRPSEILPYSPIAITVWITDKCNLKCDFCLRNIEKCEYRHKILPDMTIDTFKRILGVFRNVVRVAFIGQGEPLLNEDFFEMVKYAKREKKAISVVTNGVLLDRAIADKFMRNRIQQISISLKASSPEEFESLTHLSGQLYYSVIEGVKFLVESKTRFKSETEIELTYVLSKKRLATLPAVIKLADNLHVDLLSFQNLIPHSMFNHEGAQDVLFEDDEEVKNFISEMKKIPRKVRIFWPILLRKNNYQGCCFSCFDSLGIDAQGNVSACHRNLAPSPEYGNIFSDPNVWNSAYMRQLRKYFSSGENKLPDRCKFCVDMSYTKHKD